MRALIAILAFVTIGTGTAYAKDATPAAHSGPTGVFVVLEAHASLLADLVDHSMLSTTFGGALKGGWRGCGWGVFLQIEQNAWLVTELSSAVVKGALNIGVGGELVYADGFVRTSAAFGPSILMMDTILDDAGETGFYFDLRPAGLRWDVHEHVAITLDPISFAIVAPVLGGIPLVKVEYRTVLAVEGLF